MRAVGVGRRGRNAVDHGAGEANLGFNPGCEVRIDLLGESQHGGTGQLAVVGQVVTAENGKRWDASRLTVTQGVDDQAENGFGQLRMGQIGHDGGRLELQRPRGQIKKVPFFGDREADDARTRIAHLGQQTLFFLVFGAAQHVDDGANDTDPFGVGTVFRHGVKTVLRHQRIAHSRRLHAGTDDAPGEIAGIEHRFGHQRLMRPMKRPQPQMHDRSRHLASVVHRAPNGCWHTGQCLFT